jgi:hypothetical protein
MSSVPRPHGGNKKAPVDHSTGAPILSRATAFLGVAWNTS